jgi:hypothetical protein
MTGSGSAARGGGCRGHRGRPLPQGPQWTGPAATARQQVIDLFTGASATLTSRTWADPTETQLTEHLRTPAITSSPRITWSSISPGTAKS